MSAFFIFLLFLVHLIRKQCQRRSTMKEVSFSQVSSLNSITAFSATARLSALGTQREHGGLVLIKDDHSASSGLVQGKIHIYNAYCCLNKLSFHCICSQRKSFLLDGSGKLLIYMQR